MEELEKILKECPRIFEMKLVLNILLKILQIIRAKRSIHKPIRKLYIHAYQSIIWNSRFKFISKNKNLYSSSTLFEQVNFCE